MIIQNKFLIHYTFVLTDTLNHSIQTKIVEKFAFCSYPQGILQSFGGYTNSLDVNNFQYNHYHYFFLIFIQRFLKQLHCLLFLIQHNNITFLVHLDQRSMGTIAIIWHPSSVNFSNFKLLLRNHWANWNQTQQECSLDDPLQSFCFSFQSDIQQGCQGQ